MEQRDAVFSNEINSWPSHLKLVERIRHECARNRDGLNEVRIKVRLPPMDQTPPYGVTMVPPVDKSQGHHSVSPLDAVRETKTEFDSVPTNNSDEKTRK
jgi:hypothetical protein